MLTNKLHFVSVPIPVAAALVFEEGRLLIAQRQADKHLGGLWEFPGGKLERGESFEDCLRRELREELGIEVSVGSLFASAQYSYPIGILRIQFYQCVLKSGKPKAIECQSFKWVACDELDSFAFPSADASLLRKIKETPALWSIAK